MRNENLDSSFDHLVLREATGTDLIIIELKQLHKYNQNKLNCQKQLLFKSIENLKKMKKKRKKETETENVIF